MELTTASTLERWFTDIAIKENGHQGVDYARERLRTDSSQVVAAYWRLIATHSWREQLSKIDCPVTVVAAASDKSFPVPDVREVSMAIPNSRFVELPGPHMLPLETPLSFRDVLASHMRR